MEERRVEFEKLKRIIAEVLGVDENEIKPETTFKDLDADSIDVLQIVMQLENEFDKKVDDEALGTINTVGDAAELMRRTIEKDA